jgi:hypothetical protein
LASATTAPDGVERPVDRLHLMVLARLGDDGVGRGEDRCVLGLNAPGSGTLPSQFLAIIDSERCARLPRSLARSALMRLTIASWL